MVRIREEGKIKGLELLEDVSRPRELPGLTQRVVELPNGELILNSIGSGAALPQHRHAHLQFGFALMGEFDLLVGEPPATHTIGVERAYLLEADVLHGAEQRGDSNVLSIDLKLLSPEARSLPEIVFFEPIFQRFGWGKRYSYRLPRWNCEYNYLDPWQEISVEPQGNDQYLIVKESESQEPGSVRKLCTPVAIKSEDSGLHLVSVEIFKEGGRLL